MVAEDEGRQVPFIMMSGRQLGGIVAIGLVAGLLSWGLALLIDQYVLKSIFCQATITEQCAATTNYARGIAMVLATGIAVFGLVKLQVFRPLLVGLGSVIALWGVWSTLSVLPIWQTALIAAVLFAVAYLFFAWIARIHSFILALVVTIIVVVGVRLALNS